MACGDSVDNFLSIPLETRWMPSCVCSQPENSASNTQPKSSNSKTRYHSVESMLPLFASGIHLLNKLSPGWEKEERMSEPCSQIRTGETSARGGDTGKSDVAEYVP